MAGGPSRSRSPAAPRPSSSYRTAPPSPLPSASLVGPGSSEEGDERRERDHRVEERLRRLTDRLVADGAVTLAAAAEALGVSEMTVRRDLDELEERGTARRVRGRGPGRRPPAVRRAAADRVARQGPHRGQAGRDRAHDRRRRVRRVVHRDAPRRLARRGQGPHGDHQRTRHVRCAPRSARRARAPDRGTAGGADRQPRRPPGLPRRHPGRLPAVLRLGGGDQPAVRRGQRRRSRRPR